MCVFVYIHVVRAGEYVSVSTRERMCVYVSCIYTISFVGDDSLVTVTCVCVLLCVRVCEGIDTTSSIDANSSSIDANSLFNVLCVCMCVCVRVGVCGCVWVCVHVWLYVWVCLY